MSKARTIFHVDMDAFFASVEVALDPSLKGKPVIVGGPKDVRGVVSAASYEARKYGVHSAMPLREAARKCPEGIFLPGRHDVYSEFSERIEDIFCEFTPTIEKVSLDEAFLDFTGFGWLYKKPILIARAIKRRVLEETGLTCSVGIATNKTIAKIASDFLKPNGITEVRPGAEKEFLRDVAIREMPGIGRRIEPFFRKLGIRTLGEMARLPKSFFKITYGKYGELLWRRVNGIDNAAVAPYEGVKSVSRARTFREDVDDGPAARSTLLYLLDKCTSALRKTKKEARTITVRVRFADFRTVGKSLTLGQGISTSQEVYQTALRIYRNMIRGSVKKIRLLGVGFSNLVSGRKQLSFFDNLRVKNMGRAVDRIRRKYGFGAVTLAGILESFRKDSLIAGSRASTPRAPRFRNVG